MLPSLIPPGVYRDYLHMLLKGNRAGCNRVVNQLMEQNIPLKTLYEDLFRASLYHIGELWEKNRISVAREHLATSITETLMTGVYPLLFDERIEPKGRAVISCTANELHQVGGKMAADILEINGWDTHFLGANTPVDQLIAHLDETTPDLLGLSLSIYFGLPELEKTIQAVQHHYPGLDIFAGGQAFRWGGQEILDHYRTTSYIPTLDILETEITGKHHGS
ncbi:cobalamin B12-binding domain-containing protein [Desulfoplanes sp.]